MSGRSPRSPAGLPPGSASDSRLGARRTSGPSSGFSRVATAKVVMRRSSRNASSSEIASGSIWRFMEMPSSEPRITRAHALRVRHLDSQGVVHSRHDRLARPPQDRLQRLSNLRLLLRHLESEDLHQLEDPGLLLEQAAHAGESAIEPGRPISRLTRRLVDALDPGARGSLQSGCQQSRLVAEVVVDRRLGDSRAGCQLIDAGAGIALLGEELRCGLEDPLATQMAGPVAASRHNRTEHSVQFLPGSQVLQGAALLVGTGVPPEIHSSEATSGQGYAP